MRIKKTCDICATTFEVWPSRAKEVRCSRACSNLARRVKALSSRADVKEQPVGHKIIISSNGKRILVSNEDFDDLKLIPWNVNSSGYVLSNDVLLHRVVMERWKGIPSSMRVDHMNRDKLDCRRTNLRIATSSQNNINVAVRKNKSSKYVGVKKNRWAGWTADLWKDKTNVWIGSFADEDEAAWMRDQWAIALHGDFAVLNFDYQ